MGFLHLQGGVMEAKGQVEGGKAGAGLDLGHLQTQCLLLLLLLPLPLLPLPPPCR